MEASSNFALVMNSLPIFKKTTVLSDFIAYAVPLVIYADDSNSFLPDW